MIFVICKRLSGYLIKMDSATSLGTRMSSESRTAFTVADRFSPVNKLSSPMISSRLNSPLSRKLPSALRFSYRSFPAAKIYKSFPTEFSKNKTSPPFKNSLTVWSIISRRTECGRFLNKSAKVRYWARAGFFDFRIRFTTSVFNASF